MWLLERETGLDQDKREGQIRLGIHTLLAESQSALLLKAESLGLAE